MHEEIVDLLELFIISKYMIDGSIRQSILCNIQNHYLSLLGPTRRAIHIIAKIFGFYSCSLLSVYAEEGLDAVLSCLL